VNFGHYCRIKVIFSVVMVPYIFNSSEHITVNGPSDLTEFPIKTLCSSDRASLISK